MRDLYFKTPADFEELFSKQNRKITDMMVESIGEGIEFQKKTVTLFTINIGDDEFKYEINLPRSQWQGALESCLEVYQKMQATDEIIDTYLLIKETKKWGTKQS